MFTQPLTRYYIYGIYKAQFDSKAVVCLAMISCAVFVKRIEVTCNECAFPLNKEDCKAACRNDASLVSAATKKKLSCVKELIATGADVNAVCECHVMKEMLSA